MAGPRRARRSRSPAPSRGGKLALLAPSRRARIAKKDRDRAGERKALTERVRDMQSRFAAKCAQEVEARDGPGAASAAAAESTRSAARSERAAKAAEKRSRDGAGEDELAGAPQAVHDAAEAAAESQRGAARGDRDGPMLVMGDSTGGGVAARGGAAGAEWGGEASAGPEAGASGSSSSLGGAGLAEDRGEVLARS